VQDNISLKYQFIFMKPKYFTLFLCLIFCTFFVFNAQQKIPCIYSTLISSQFAVLYGNVISPAILSPRNLDEIDVFKTLIPPNFFLKSRKKSFSK